VEKLMAKSPADRYPTARSLLADLQQSALLRTVAGKPG
jgi:hypothetical protein